MKSEDSTPPTIRRYLGRCGPRRPPWLLADFNPPSFRLFSLGQRHSQNAVLITGRYLLRIDITRESERPAKGSPSDLMSEISPVVLRSFALAFTLDGQDAILKYDFHVLAA